MSNGFANITDDLVLKLRERYKSLHPLLFIRSAERAKNASELFDILDTVSSLPVTWDENSRRWITTNLL